jgi:hypothetical protein
MCFICCISYIRTNILAQEILRLILSETFEFLTEVTVKITAF